LLFASATSWESTSEETYDWPSSEYYEGIEESELPASQESVSMDDQQDEDIAACIESCSIPCDVQQHYLKKFVNDQGEPLTTEDLKKMCNDIEIVEGEERKIYEELEKLLPEFDTEVDEVEAFGLNVLEGNIQLAEDALEFAVIGEEMWEAEEEEMKADEEEMIEEAAEELVSASTSAPTDTNELELSLLKDAVKDAVNEDPVTVASLYEAAKKLLPASTSAPIDTNELELSLPKDAVKDAVNEDPVTWATLYESAKPILPAFTSAITKTYEHELPLTTTAPKKEITTVASNAESVKPILPAFTSAITKTYEAELPLTTTAPKKEITKVASNAGESVSAEKKLYAPIPYRYEALNKPVKAQITNQLPVATIEAPIIPAYTAYKNYGLPLTEKAAPTTPYTAYVSQYTPGTYAPRGQDTRAYPSTKTVTEDAHTMAPTETKPPTQVVSNSEAMREEPASHHSKHFNYFYHPKHHHHNGGH